MDLLNAQFQAVMAQRQFQLKTIEGSDNFQYKGRLSLPNQRLVDFDLRLPKSETREVVQIVFQGLATCKDPSLTHFCLEAVNYLNATQGLHYYFCLTVDGVLFARYMLPVDPDRTEVLLELIQIGSHLLKELELDPTIWQT